MSIEITKNTALYSQIFKTNFIDGTTPLNKDNLNPLIDGIKENAVNLEDVVEAINIELDRIDIDILEIDGGGVPQSVIDGTNTTWNGEFEEI